MNYKEFNVALPIKDNNVYIIDGVVQYDTANIMNVRLMDGTEPFDITGYTEVFIEIVKPDGTHVQACVSDDPEVNDDNNPYVIQVVDAKEGRISFNLHSQATILTGTHFGQIMVAGNGKILTSARINYYVGDTLSLDNDPDGVVSSDDYVSLKNLIARNSAIATEERARVDAETLRKLAEFAREERIDALEKEIRTYLENAVGYVEQTEDYMEMAQRFAELAQNPSAEIMASLIEDMNLASKEYVDDEIETETRHFDAGNYTDDEQTEKILRVRRGLKNDEIKLEEGELGFSTDTERFYIGTGTQNIPLNGVYAAQETAPEETHLLWIDISASGNGAIKYYDGTQWQPTATAAFS